MDSPLTLDLYWRIDHPARVPDVPDVMHRSTTDRSPARRVGRVHRRLLAATVALAGLGVGTLMPASPGSAAPAPMENAALDGLSEGARGSEVAALQRALMAAGVAVRGGADGVFGPATREAVMSYQRDRGLTATGSVDAATAASLDGGAPETGSSALNSSELAQGARGDEVKRLQQALMDIGVFVPGGADGVFGSATANAVTQFQRWNGLDVTGTLTAATAKLLGFSSGGGGATPAGSSGSTGSTGSSGGSETNAFVGVQRGASGSLVKQLQSALMQAGITVPGGADGAFGPATEGALKTYQTLGGRSATGVVSAADAGALGLGASSTGGGGGSAAGVATPPSTGGDSSNPYVGLTVGASGPLVKDVQEALQGFGFVIRGGANGEFGASTKSTLMAFQSVNGIARTGVVTEKGARIMKLGKSGGSDSTGSESSSGGEPSFTPIERFPVQGLCFFGDTWHAPRANGRLHIGVDIIAPEGKLLYAVADGRITKKYWDQPGALAGNGLNLTTSDGTRFTYLHLFDFAPGIEVGTEVRAGDVIGFVGNTGSSATAHLHFEIHPRGGAAINPYPYMKAIDDCKNTTPQYQQSFPGPASAAVTPAEAATAEIGIGVSD